MGWLFPFLALLFFCHARIFSEMTYEHESRLSPQESQGFKEEEIAVDYAAEVQRIEQLLGELEQKQADLQISGGEAGMMYDYREAGDEADEAAILEEQITKYRRLLRQVKEDKKAYEEASQ